MYRWMYWFRRRSQYWEQKRRFQIRTKMFLWYCCYCRLWVSATGVVPGFVAFDCIPSNSEICVSYNLLNTGAVDRDAVESMMQLWTSSVKVQHAVTNPFCLQFVRCLPDLASKGDNQGRAASSSLETWEYGMKFL